MTQEELIEQNCNTFIAAMRALREQKKFSVEEVAAKAGLKANNIERIEAGKYKPNLETLVRIADAMDVQLTFKKKP